MVGGGWPERVDEQAGRWVAGTVALGLATAWLTDRPWLVWPFAAGFVLRAAFGPRASLLARLAGTVARRLGRPRPVPSSPKRFAQILGALFSVGASAAHVTGASTIGWTLALALVACAGLEAAAGVCVGCWMYRQLQKVGLLPATACSVCVGGGQPGTAESR